MLWYFFRFSNSGFLFSALFSTLRKGQLWKLASALRFNKSAEIYNVLFAHFQKERELNWTIVVTSYNPRTIHSLEDKKHAHLISYKNSTSSSILAKGQLWKLASALKVFGGRWNVNRSVSTWIDSEMSKEFRLSKKLDWH